MIRMSVLRVSRHHNYFPDPTGISKHYLTATLLSGRKVDCKKEFVYSFGDYIQATYNTKHKNNNLPRKSHCIYFQATCNLQGGHELLDLAIGRSIVCAKVTARMMMRLAIKRVEAMVHKEGYISLKFYNCKRKVMLLENANLLTVVGGSATDVIEDEGNFSELPSEDNEYVQLSALEGKCDNESLDVDGKMDPDESTDIMHESEKRNVPPVGLPDKNDEAMIPPNYNPNNNEVDDKNNARMCHHHDEYYNDDVPSLISDVDQGYHGTRGHQQGTIPRLEDRMRKRKRKLSEFKILKKNLLTR